MAKPSTALTPPALPPRVTDFLTAYEASALASAPDTPSYPDLSPAVTRLTSCSSPFPYGTIDGLLPDDLYDGITRHWPADPHLDAVTLTGPSGAPARYIGSRKTKFVDTTPHDRPATVQETIWKKTALALRDPRLVRALFQRYADTVEANLRALAQGSPGTPGFRLYLNQDAGAKEALGAHIDALRKILTIVIYIDLRGPVTDDSSRCWGTALYDSEPGTIKPLEFSSNADHRPVTHVMFAPNRAFVMPNAPRSLHGVAGGQPGVVRRTLMCGYWLSSAG
ncbi:hypothetical protein [Streptomyces sp. NPDC006285]|uniref:hypothetical protein n=1 Tax=Streptomyces sp. NPDC006285 TaxID=3364742 RepID=UPI0036BC1941